MTELDRGLLRTLAEWDPAGLPVTSMYLDVDGRRFPRKGDYELRLDDLIRRGRMQARGFGRDVARSVDRDLGAISAFVREEFDRSDTRGIAAFSARDAGLWEVVLVPRPLRDRVVVAPTPDLLPLEALLEIHRPTGVALVDFEKARLFVVELGRIDEVGTLHDEVPARHEQGGRAQMRMQRHVDDHRARHVRRVADAVFALWRRRRFEQLVLAGPAEAHRELEPCLHDYLRRRVRASIALPIAASSAEVLARALDVEARVEREHELAAVERVRAAGARGVRGLDPTLEALASARVGELVVASDLARPGRACASCGRLATRGRRCPSCGSGMADVPDVVEAAVAAALRAGVRVEAAVEPAVGELGGIGAVLRF
jgi:peptide subunit release factor 1 (eRF1)